MVGWFGPRPSPRSRGGHGGGGRIPRPRVRRRLRGHRWTPDAPLLPPPHALVDLERLIWEHVRNHPEFAMEDLAKLLYQGALGMDHLLADRDTFLADFSREWEALDSLAFPGEPLLEPVPPDGRVARLNLRPAKAAGISLTMLGPMLADQPRRHGSWAEFMGLWGAAVTLARDGRIPFPPDELVARGNALESGRQPPGHSPLYREINRPAYRLLHDVTQHQVR